MNQDDFEYREGRNMPGKWLWPRYDRVCWRFLTKKGSHKFGGIEYFASAFPNHVARLMTGEKNLVIQAGGNAGLYPLLYSKTFKNVITFEADPIWFHCLTQNCTAPNVTAYNAAVGSSNEGVSVVFNTEIKNGTENWGAKRVELGGETPQMTIDELNVDPDLIHLDIEGFEGEALVGATETIKRCKPMIVLETNDSGDKYGWPLQRIEDMLKTWGYKPIMDWHHDKAYTAQ